MDAKPRRLLHEALIEGARRYPEKTALLAEGRSYSYAELYYAATQLAGALQRRGLKRGDRVAIYLDNGWHCAVAIYASLIAGGVFVIINPLTKVEKLAYILRDSGAVALLTDAHLQPWFLPALGQAPGVRAVIAAAVAQPFTSSDAPPVESLEAVLAEVGSPAAVPVIPLDLAALIYTSGSTGDPKGVMHTHQSMVFATGSLTEYLRLDERDRLLCVLPLAFDYGLYQLLMAIALGATLVLERSFTYPTEVFRRMTEAGVTVFPGVPTIFAMLIAAHRRRPLCFPAVTRVTNTAAALPDEYVRELREIFPAALLFRMYGLTECKRVCYLEPELVDAKPASVGKAIPGTEVFLLSPSGEEVAPGEAGVLHVRGPHLMLGYWNQPDLSAAMLKPGRLPGERVLCTQDWFRMDAEGFLYFVGRSDDIIKTRGEKVSPVEVEGVLLGIPNVLEAAVVGVPDALLGQSIRAYVVVEPGSVLNERKIKQVCVEKLESFMVPRDVVLVGELPKTATGKISKRTLGKEETSA